MSDGPDLRAFLAARLDEDEAAAKAATAGPWAFEGDDPTDDELYSVHDGIVDLVGVTVAFTRDRQVANGQHMARHDPARVLREVEGKRKILAEHKAVTRLAGLTGQELGFLGWYREWMLKNLAAAYADHPDYQPEWKP